VRVLLDECLPRRAFDIAVIVLIAPSNRIDDLRPLAPQILEVLPNARRGAATLIELDPGETGS
jgi:hypothetical protein